MRRPWVWSSERLSNRRDGFWVMEAGGILFIRGRHDELYKAFPVPMGIRATIGMAALLVVVCSLNKVLTRSTMPPSPERRMMSCFMP